jgi:hypothetical protein
MRDRFEQAAGILAAEKLPLRAAWHKTGAALYDEAGTIVWTGRRSELVAEVRRRVVEAVSARAKAAAADMPDLPTY